MGIKTESELAHIQQLMNQLTPIQIYFAGLITGTIFGLVVGVVI